MDESSATVGSFPRPDKLLELYEFEVQLKYIICRSFAFHSNVNMHSTLHRGGRIRLPGAPGDWQPGRLVLGATMRCGYAAGLPILPQGARGDLHPGPGRSNVPNTCGAVSPWVMSASLKMVACNRPDADLARQLPQLHARSCKCTQMYRDQAVLGGQAVAF